jgi:surface protein
MGLAALLCVASLVPAVAGDSIHTAVDAWLADPTAAEATYGHISTWDTSGVTSMRNLFHMKRTFNEDIGAWDTSGVTTMEGMFDGCYAFNQDIGAWDTSGVTDMSDMFYLDIAFNQDIGDWDTSGVTTMENMFYRASAFDQDLGWCVADDVDLRDAFKYTPCESTSCGVTQGGCAGWFGSSSQKSNGDGVADDDKMMTLVVLAGLLGLSLAIAAGLFALRQQQQLAAKTPRAPRTFTVTAVQSA